MARTTDTKQDEAGLALWIGPEPTVNRVGDEWFDQLEAGGFAHRLEDIDRLASIGAARVRFPVLWERVAPDAPDSFDWAWSDERLARLRALGLNPIAGLLHHGSGPRYTDLLDPAFSDKFARYAHAVATRYPWIDMWTPVNEPCTTARFSGLYGHWYPHVRDGPGFLRMLLNQVQATRAAMRAIRSVIPAAQLVQTEDLGHVRATPRLRYQARYENERRWLTFDLLMGRVDRRHEFWSHLVGSGIAESELLSLVEAPCPPDILGINAYVTSERFLDHRLERYPPSVHGGNEHTCYADVEGVRSCAGPIGGFDARLRETHQRYGRPMAITEAHMGCTREEQMRWLLGAWRAAERARTRGCDVRAVTAWAAFGAHEWNSLLTRREDHYESGLWDVRGPQPRETALAGLARALASGTPPRHAVLQAPGWWQRAERIAYGPATRVRGRIVRGRPLLVLGAGGTLGQAFVRACTQRGLAHLGMNRVQCDVADAKAVAGVLCELRPWAVINSAGFVRVDEAEDDARQWRENAAAVGVLAMCCARSGVRLLTVSSDLVFDGSKGSAYVEHDAPAPLNAYGRAKAEAERLALGHSPDALVIRTAAFFGPWDAHNFVVRALASLRAGVHWDAAEDLWVSPTYVPSLVNAALDLLIDGAAGMWHIANRGVVSWADLARQAAELDGQDVRLIRGVPAATLHLRAPRPRYVPLASRRGWHMPTLEQGLVQCVQALRRDWPHPARA